MSLVSLLSKQIKMFSAVAFFGLSSERAGAEKVFSISDPKLICSGVTVAGITGTAICQSGSGSGADASANDVFAEKSVWNSSGVVVNGSLVIRGSLNVTESFPGAGKYSGVSQVPTSSALCSGTTLFGVQGDAVCQSSASGTAAVSANVLAGKYFWSDSGLSTQGTLANRGVWDATTAFPGEGFYTGISNAPAASSLCAGKNFNGAAGSATCGKYSDLMASGMHRDRGGTPTQLTISGERSAENTLPSGYREIPDVDKDDEGVGSTTNVTTVTRGTNVWNGSIPRKVCGMGIATLAGRIADCDTRHSAKPSWDGSANDGKITWDGAKNGLASEGTWTLVTVYDSSKNNGDDCGADCKEVWRDDRTGLLWSDKLGDSSTNANSGKFNWCLASGNTENSGGVDCSIGASGSYNKAGVSLCAEASGLVTPAGVHNTTSANDISSWADVGTSIRDAKGGMLKAANTDPAATAQSPSVRWRLPTKYDWERADIDGIGRVVPNFAGASNIATLNNSGGTSVAWYFGANFALFSNSAARTLSLVTRCVGR